jgi:primosomal protein N' (replication factor Y)
VPPLPEVSRRFVEWVADYTVNSPGAVLRMVASVPDALETPRAEPVYAPVEPLPPMRLTAARARVLEVVARDGPNSAARIAAAAGVSAVVVAALVKGGALRARPPGDAASLRPKPDPSRPGPVLAPAQADAAAALAAAVGTGFSVTLLDGVAGSGKTETYFEAIAAALRAGRQTLVLLPEIALSAQWLARFAARFGAEPWTWHSDLRAGRRRRTWRAVAEGVASVVVGARSALFLPYPQLGLIVVDEEHDGAFKQEDGVAYHARDMAVVRGRLGAIPVVLASATPSLETLNNVRRRRYRRLVLPERHGGATPPAVSIADLRVERPPAGGFLSPPLRERLRQTLQQGEQSLLFLNRRGYAPLTLCRACGHRIQCAQCSAWMVEHRRLGRLICHHCGASLPLPSTCPACAATGSLMPCGPGVERLAEEVTALLPGARLLLATSDTLTGPTAAAELVRRIEAGEADVIVGTQVVAKGYHFPLLTLVGVVDADLGLAGGDLRAAERTFQLLTQVAGRAGRARHPGQVIIQSLQPDHPVITALAALDRDRFVAAECEARRAAGMPPFGRLAAVIVSAADAVVADQTCRMLAAAAPVQPGITVWGPAPAPLALLRGRHRRRFLLHGPMTQPLPPVVRRWLAGVKLPAGARVQVDVDPMSFL